MGVGIGSIANTGLKAAMTNMSTISNNISNANTVGFKKSQVNFADIYPGGFSSSGQVAGYGVRIQSIKQDFSLGRIDLTGRGLDLCLNTDGFLVEKDSAGKTSYTRAGNLSMDLNGYLTGSSGKIQGYPAVNGQIVPSGNLVDMQVSQEPSPARATANSAIALNLDASALPPATSTFSATDTSSYNFRSNTTVFDSLGNPYDMSVFYIKTADNDWTTQVMMDTQSLGTGSVQFQSNGAISSVAGMDNLSWAPTGGATSPQVFSIDLSKSTQYSGDNTIRSNEQDGYQAGVPTGFNVDGSGNINVSYTNGQTQLQGQIALAQFIAPQGLDKTDNMSWLETVESGNPVFNPATNAGAFSSGMLELSNVDLTEELINLMSAQHDFQANSQVMQTYNQVLQTIENI